MRQFPKALAFMTGLMLVGSPSAAQIGPRIIDSLQIDRRIRVETVQGARIDGRVLMADSGWLRLRVIERASVHSAVFATRQISLDSLVRVWVHDGTGARTGALIGGLAVGVTFGSLALALCGDPDGGGCDPAQVVGAVAVLSGIGAALGGFLGATVVRWRPL